MQIGVTAAKSFAGLPMVPFQMFSFLICGGEFRALR
jgi:hypothetical protein